MFEPTFTRSYLSIWGQVFVMSEPTFMPLFIKVGSGYLCLNGPEQPRAHSNLFSLHLLNDRISAEAFNSCIVKYLNDIITNNDYS